ncbi:MAG: 4-alpha-glucanotransferase [Oxalobacter sp.]|nr:MAG: 4-alpha-glucanotransferase [Oxalobacter sp.]
MTTSSTSPRLSGILLHPTSLPGAHGAGDLGASAYHFIDWLATARQSLWQVLPLGCIGLGNSPYMSPSAFAGSILLIDLLQLHEASWLEETDLIPEDAFENRRVNYSIMTPFRTSRLRKAAARFFETATQAARADFQTFCTQHASWLDDYTLFRALTQTFGAEVAWQDWPAPLAQRKLKALQDARNVHANEIDFWKFCQWQFFAQWKKLKTYANAKGVDIVGDIPIFVSLQSADVWAHPELFDLNAKGRPTVVAGVPPDVFSKTGQRWGNPLYRWASHAASDYRWWVERMRHSLAMFDKVRIDHFRGFESYWEIPAKDDSAVGGRWMPGPGAAVFDAMRKQLGKVPVIAEDLGLITPEVIALRQQLGLPGMRILQFAFDGDADNLYLPHNFKPGSVVYTGTHDNNTTRGWWNTIDDAERDRVRRYFAISGDWIHWDMIRAASASVAELAILPMQDVLGLDGAHRMNCPGEASGSWEWRFTWQMVEDWHAAHLAELTTLYGRHRSPPPPNTPEDDVK